MAVEAFPEYTAIAGEQASVHALDFPDAQFG
jgi:hypothetical protein